MERELKENELIVSPCDKFSYQIIPLTDIQIVVTREELQAIKNKTKCFDVENNCVIPYDNTEYVEAKKIEELRQLRTPLLQAFDIYKSNVNYGIEADANREKIIVWYKAILDLYEDAIDNPPIEIRRYM